MAFMKSILKIVLCCVITFMTIDNVFAEEVFYINKYGVSFTQKEYEFLSEMFWEGSQDLMTYDLYNNFINSGLLYGKLEVVLYNSAVPFSTSFSDTAKTLKIAKVCSSTCTISVTLNWKSIPSVKSYDVIGAYLSNTKLLKNPVTTYVSTTQSGASSEMKSSSNGFGVSVLLPKTGNDIVINQTYKVSTGGIVYASYQHAKFNTTLATSKNYTISRSGYGGVFAFSGEALNVYDKMSGVSITT